MNKIIRLINSVLRRRLVMLLGILIVSAAASGCSRGGVAEEKPTGPLHTEISQSVPRSGGAISAQSKILTPVVKGQPVVIELVFGTEPGQDLWLEIADSDAFELKGDYRRVLEVRKKGVVKEYIQLTPLQAGKHYLKMTVSHAGGESPRALVVILPVVDDKGNMPEPQKEERSRVEFRATPVE